MMTVPVIMAQQRNKPLNIQVLSVDGDDLTSQPVVLMQTDYQVSYGQLKLDAEGVCRLNVYPGNHQLTVERDGFETLSHTFFVAEDATNTTYITVTLKEKTRQPYALTATVAHDATTGDNRIDISWNTEQPAFFDDFESYEPFAINFGEWTGIDADNEAAAPLIGSYPNRGVMQYAQIINPLTVNPTWWYDYPILRPYDGQQYVGFTRTSSGLANDDWLISPTITVGTDNVLSFFGKAADRFAERFMVYVTTTLDNPTQADFTRIDKDNYESADYRGWQQYTYDLSHYEGQQIKFAIRYVSNYNLYGSFMLMIDNVYVGQQDTEPFARRQAPSASRVSSHDTMKSPANPNEQFRVFLDDALIGTTTDYNYTLTGVAPGNHTIGVQAVYLKTVSEVTTVDVTVPENIYAHVVFNVTTNSILAADGVTLSLLNMETAMSYQLTVADGKAEMLSLPRGQYILNIEEGAFETYQQTITVDGDATFDIVLNDHIQDPYNITATIDDDLNLILNWNQELSFTDSFEEYDDFATGTFGEWTTLDQDLQPVYPIALGSQTNIVSFPGSGSANNPTAIAPMVFNPWKTQPPMLPTDQAIAAPTGDKTVIFFSPQRVKADKWLISPLFDIHDRFQVSVKAKGYTSMYPESIEFCVSDGSDNPDDFKVVSEVDNLASEQWALYTTDLSAYAGQTVRLAIHYTSTDAFLAQIDDFTVGLPDGQGETVNYGNVVRFDIYLDGTLVGESTTPSFVIPDVEPGRHVVSIQAIYKNGVSGMVDYVVGETDAISCLPVSTTLNSTTIYDLQGRRINENAHSKGIYLMNANGTTRKVLK